ncbi:uncharacterized protein LOC132050769 [Lycium ferocissimum]|uniref:uncharacterized protein LOC132050769 n=1 Tax=Lycium ferocissimum TaxID=112874 RepID=UPI002815E56E|nr:uncharacterized protein LOC132050769 [Lycium ferocissimum]
MLQIKRINFVGLIETRVKQHRAKGILANIAPGWGYLDNYQSAANGRIWILWDTNKYQIHKLREEDQLIHCQVKGIREDFECLVTIIYGFNTGELRKTLWQSLRDIAQGISTPWMIAGDFNALLYAQDRLLGNPVQYAEIKDFSGCITDLLLNELHWRGSYYTWSNKQQGGDRICSRLDRAFGNLEWMMKWGHVMVEYELPNISDHSPMVMIIQATQNTIKIPFRFFNVWAEHKQFLAIVEAAWCKKTNANKMRNIWAKLKDLKPKLKQLNNAEYRNITQILDKARFDLINIQKQIQLCYTDSLQNQEKTTMQELEKWSLIEESIMRQKSRARWIKLGDANTKYFSAVLKERTQRKQISELTSITGVRLVEQEAIKNEITGFYRNLMGTLQDCLTSHKHASHEERTDLKS